jgi:hypothetical protein
MDDITGYIPLEKFNCLSEAKVPVISTNEIDKMANLLSPLIGVQFNVLSLPEEILLGFEPSQIGTIVGSLMDACIPQLASIPTTNPLPNIGLSKHTGILGEREGYPDYLHDNGYRLELKLLYVDNESIEMKKPPTPREPSARLTQKVTFKNVMPDKDILLVIAYDLEENISMKKCYSPTVKSIGLFSVYECILARDLRMYRDGGGWFGYMETPTILSKIGEQKIKDGGSLDYSSYGRKESEGKDLNEDTNFGKLKRIPYEPLQKFLALHSI